MKKIGIFGGSFDPVHNEHINMALSAIKELALDVLYVIPTYKAPHKSGAVATAEDRYNMLCLAFKNQEKVVVSRYELDLKSTSYTYLTIQYFKQKYKDSEIFFIMGSDMLSSFTTWKNPQIISQNAHLVLTSRQGEDNLDETSINEVKSLYGAKITRLNYVGSNLSSTIIRVYLSLGLDASAYAPQSVLDYAVKNQIYSKNKLYNYVNNALPTKRKIHTAGVIITAINLAKKLKVDKEKAEISALLHDIAKYKNKGDYPNIKELETCEEPIAHQYIGAYIAKEELGILDEEILDAIKYHSTGKPNMSALSKVLYVADLIEPSRKYEGVDLIREKIEKDFDDGFIYAVCEVLEFLKQKQQPINQLTIDTAKYYKGE